MIQKNHLLVLRTLALAAVLFPGIPRTVLAADPPALSELATAARQKVGRSREARLREIVSRQKGDQLKVYLRGSRSVFVNGKSISRSDLSTLIRATGLKKAAITAALNVHPDRFTEVEQWLRKDGIENVQLAELPATLSDLAALSRKRAERHQESSLREILARQQGDQLEVYLNSRSAYINGRSISGDLLVKIVAESGLKKAIITSDRSVTPLTIAVWKEKLRKAGIEEGLLPVRDAE